MRRSFSIRRIFRPDYSLFLRPRTEPGAEARAANGATERREWPQNVIFRFLRRLRCARIRGEIPHGGASPTSRKDLP